MRNAFPIRIAASGHASTVSARPAGRLSDRIARLRAGMDIALSASMLLYTTLPRNMQRGMCNDNGEHL